jgi:HAD superfamily hydrolase (TIGR01509 family)
LCLFDLDYTLIRLKSDPVHVYADVLSQGGFNVDSNDLESAYRASWDLYLTQGSRYPTDRDAYLDGASHTLSLLGIEDVNDLIAEEIIGRSEISESVELYQDSIPLLRELRAGGYRIGIATGRWHDPAIDVEAVGLAPCVDVVYHSGMLGSQKNEPKFWTMLLEREGLAIDEVALVDDNAAAVSTAQTMGMKAFRIQRHDSPIGSPEFADITDLSGLSLLLEST